MIKQKSNSILKLKRIIIDIENYNKDNGEWRYSNVVENLVDKLNELAKELDLIEFKLEEFHYSSTGKTINKIGYQSLLGHTSILKEVLESDEVIFNNTSPSSNSENDKVFIVHGRDRQALLEMESIIYRSGLKPIVLDRAV